MIKSYIILPKKSIIRLLAGLFLFLLVLPVNAAEPNDPSYLKQKPVWDQINAPSAWDASAGSSDVVVAVIDIGVDIDHPDLKQNIWVNADEIAGNGIDDDGNGFIDDVNGWNFVEDNNNVRPPEKSGFGDAETVEHGTLIAGLIGAVGNNGINGSGANWKVKIMPVRTINNYGAGSYDDISEAIDYAAGNGASIISISFVGDSEEEVLKQALRRAYERGVLSVAAAGNSQMIGNAGDLNIAPNYPVCFDSAEDNWLIGVTSINDENRLSNFANYGRCIDLVAPGEKIYSTELSLSRNNYTGFGGPWDGTSFSVPFVAGAAALVKSIRPDWLAKDLMENLLATADEVDSANPSFVGRLGYGRLNVGRAVAKAVEDKTNFGIFDRLCFVSGTRLYCYQVSTGKNVYLADLGRSAVAYDWRTGGNSAVLTGSAAGYDISLFSDKGVLTTAVFLPQGPKFNSLKFIFVNDQWRLFTAGYDAKNRLTSVYQYDLSGNFISKISVSGILADWAVGSSGALFGAAVVRGRINIVSYDSSGKKISEKAGPPGQSASDMVIGRFWVGDSSAEQAAFVVRNGKVSYLAVVDLLSGGYIRDILPVSAAPWRLLSGDDNHDQILEIFRYNLAGGKCEIVTGKGKLLRSVVLPKLK
jgi:subtilisin family serine protease